MLNLFLTFFKIGAFTFGGGYAMMPLIEKELVEKQEILSDTEYINALVVAQSFPGALAVNMSLLIGYRFYKRRGAVIAMLGTILPSFFSIILIAVLYDVASQSIVLNGFLSGVQPVVAALLFYSAIKLSMKMNKHVYNYALLISSFIAVGILGINPIIVIILGGLLSLWKPCS